MIEIASRAGEGRGDVGPSGLPLVSSGEAEMSATILHPDPNDERIALLAKLLTRLGVEATVVRSTGEAQKQISAGAGRHLLVIADDDPTSSLAGGAVDLADSSTGNLFVIYVADTMPVEYYKRLVRTGAGEWIKWQALPRELGEIVRSFQATKVRAPAREAATIVSFFPSKGGVGNTTLAVESAVATVLRNKGLRDRVAVVGLDFQGSTLGDALDLPSRFDIAEILARPDRLDAQLVDIFASKHTSSVNVFSCVPHFGEGIEIPPEVVFALLDQIGSKYDIVILDLPSQWQPWTDNVLLGSSAIVVTGESTVPGLRQVTNRLTHLDALGLTGETVSVLINRCQTGMFGRIARRADIERALPDRKIHYVAADPGLASEAANAGQPMVQLGPRRPVSKTIRRLGDWIQTLRKAS